MDGMRANHDEAIRKLAASSQLPFEEVKRVYERQLERLRTEAKVTTYLEVFAERLTREELNQRH